MLKEKDADKNGELSFQEYVGDRGHDKDKEWLISEKDRWGLIQKQLNLDTIYNDQSMQHQNHTN